MKLLVADIGGTNARFGFQDDPGSKITSINHLECKNFPNIEDAIEFYISANKLKVKNLSLSVAGPCGQNIVKLTNNHWRFDKRKVLKNFACDSILAINDFAAQGLGLSKFLNSKKLSFSSKFLSKHKIMLIKKSLVHH